MPGLVVVADDLTGAADTGACFAGAGLATTIPLSGSSVSDADVIVLSTESRDLEAEAAAQAVSAAVTRLIDGLRDADSGPRWVYKKIDSVLRGQPRAELLAAMDATGVRRAMVAPAFAKDKITYFQCTPPGGSGETEYAFTKQQAKQYERQGYDCVKVD